MSTLSATLNSIATELTRLAENYHTDEIDEDEYAFALNELLDTLPTPSAPLHIEVLERVKDWHAARLIPDEILASLRQRVLASARGAGGASSSGGDMESLGLDHGEAADDGAPPPCVCAPLPLLCVCVYACPTVPLTAAPTPHGPQMFLRCHRHHSRCYHHLPPASSR